MVNTLLLPDFVKGLPENLQFGWLNVYREIYTDYGENLARIGANNWLKRELDLIQEDNSIVPEDGLDTPKEELVEEEKSPIKITFEIDSKEGILVKRDAQGNDYIDMVLQDCLTPDHDGQMWSEKLLQKWADEINSGKVEVLGDIDHEDYDDIVEKHFDIDTIKRKLAERKQTNSIAKGVQAIVDKGRLWLRALIDKRYKKLITKGTGVSIEAYADRKQVHEDGDLLGFSFILNNPVGPSKQTARVA